MVLGHIYEEDQRTEDVKITHDVTFESMLLSQKTLRGLKESGFYRPSPIQLHGIPLGKCGFDLMLEAKSGTGKTAVFTIIALEKIDLNNELQVIVLTPTREIAAQISDVIKQIGSFYDELQVEVVMGGLSVQDDISKFNKKVHIVVGSPGRVRHLIRDKHINTSGVRLLILDEADKLIEKCFLADINYIFSSLPNQKQVILSSATYPENSRELITKYMQAPQHICPDTSSILLGISQKITLVQSHANIVRQTEYRFEELLKILKKFHFKQCLIFCNYQARVTELHKMLKKNKWPAEQLYGQQEQTDRLDALKTLQQYKCRLLVSTDLAARGIDASNVDLVINFEPPYDWPTYLHRIGRAGRFGSYGVAITILSQGKEENQFRNIIDSMKILINMTLLWTNEKFFINKTEDISSNNHLQEFLKDDLNFNHNGDKVLDATVTDQHQTQEPQGTDTLESFSDLLDSFQNDDYRNDNTQFQHLSILSHKKDIDNSNYNSLSGKDRDSQNRSIQNSEEEISIQKAEINHSTQNIYKNNDNSDKQQTEGFELHSLPTAFLDQKTMNRNQFLKSKKANEKVCNKNKPCKLSNKKNVNDRNSNDVIVKDHEQLNNVQKNTYMRHISTKHTQTSKLNYYQWYNQLKFNMKQIEVAVYLAEMSNLSSY